MVIYSTELPVPSNISCKDNCDVWIKSTYLLKTKKALYLKVKERLIIRRYPCYHVSMRGIINFL